MDIVLVYAKGTVNGSVLERCTKVYSYGLMDSRAAGSGAVMSRNSMKAAAQPVEGDHRRRGCVAEVSRVQPFIRGISRAWGNENRGVPRLFDVWKVRAGDALRTLDPNLGREITERSGDSIIVHKSTLNCARAPAPGFRRFWTMLN
jgi:hypothetical protein